MVIKKAVPVLGILLALQVSAQEFTPASPRGPLMKYQVLRDTDPALNTEFRERGLKEWVSKRDTTLEKAKKLLEEKNYVLVNQLLFPYDYLEPEDAVFYDYLGKSYFYSGLFQPALDCFTISNEEKKQAELYFFIGQCQENLGNEKEAQRAYKKGAKEGNEACKAKLSE